MNNKIKCIKEETPQIIMLPNGYYFGIWGGDIIKVEFLKKIYLLETYESVRGFGYRVVVHVENGIATFDELNN